MSPSWLKKYNLLMFNEIDSTNSEAIRLAKSGIVGNFVIFTEHQLAGRGRNGKQWKSGVGNLYVSLLLEANMPIVELTQVSFVAAVAVQSAISSLIEEGGKVQGLEITLKWPNDVLINGKKVAGILLESISLSTKNYLVVGVGVNIEVTPSNIEKPATSLEDNGIEVPSTTYVLDKFVEHFDKYYSEWKNYGFTKIRKRWLSSASKLNEMVTIDDGNSKCYGRFIDIDEVGNIRLQLENGEIKSLSTGEVFFGI